MVKPQDIPAEKSSHSSFQRRAKHVEAPATSPNMFQKPLHVQTCPIVVAQMARVCPPQLESRRSRLHPFDAKTVLAHTEEETLDMYFL